MEVEELKAILEDKDVITEEEAEEEEEIIYATEEVEEIEDTDETHTEEIVEIIEEIEVVESEEEDNLEQRLARVVQEAIEETVESADSQDESQKQAVQKSVSKTLDNGKKNSYERVVNYDAEEDWEEEENDPLDDRNSVKNQAKKNISVNSSNASKGAMSNGNKITHTRTEQVNRALKPKNLDYPRGMEIPRHDDDDESPHEIVKNSENDLVYTVLGTKKQNEAAKQSAEEKLQNARYIKMERLEEDTIPVEGTIYYEGDDMGTLYVAHSVNENEQYFEEQAIEQEEPHNEEQEQWAEADDVVMVEQAEEENTQEQIFLHEDENGQLYVKDENGQMQPVFMNEDGDYVFQETASDDQESQEPKSSLKHSEDTSELQELDSVSNRQVSPTPSLVNNELDNEDNTVTISLIISEDENGMKRTQVIIPTSDALKCEICQKSFKTQFQLLRHNRLKHAREEDITVRNFPCDLCPKRFPDQNSLAKHRKVHTGDRPFQCLECHEQFPSPNSLRRHMGQHNPNSKPLPCIYCGRRFMDKQTLQKHEQSHLAGEQQRSHTCDICHKSFMTPADLTMHKKNHDPDKKFDCEVCGREFNRLNNLQRHMLVHQQVRGKQPPQGQNQEILSCDVCGITYKFMSSLTRHMVTSHMNPEKLRQQAEEQRRKRENNYKRYLENRKMYETQHVPVYGKRSYRSAVSSDPDDDLDA